VVTLDKYDIKDQIR